MNDIDKEIIHKSYKSIQEYQKDTVEINGVVIPKQSVVGFAEHTTKGSIQINLHYDTQFNYWFIEPRKTFIKLEKGKLPKILINKEISWCKCDKMKEIL